ncbi:3-keto-5-aminohexanoate cleavage protein [Nocardioides immobilis]|uniref:3-keto-5-aminohexanoate cleavage protein n=1 Tax=Nocardioides immobilis TaxID=2049295 RepID=A0A417XXG3_9ACTN|nr:3-keto-5-aminohexanoate cleavage protein [Nocardioides immobilis]RHW24951.1 3-keto-5-aminohexanoate cleavage protein [Nocardioides immobilis]
MDDLIITVTCDSTMSYPGNPNMPAIEDVEAVGQQYVDAVNAGASICHHHGVHYLETEMQADGKKLSRIDHDGWQGLTDKIKTVGTDPLIQYGIASARLEEKIKLMKQGPDMMSYAFNVHDEYFRPDPAYPANEMYSLHPRDELEEASKAALEHGVKLEIECFYTGAFWNLEFIRNQALLENPVWATLFFGWQGGAWTPPTAKSMLYLVDHLPENVNWNVSIMDPATQWPLAAMAIGLGGHVRVGWEDNPYLPNGDLSKHNAQLVEVIVKMAETMGRPVATPKRAREIVFGKTSVS